MSEGAFSIMGISASALEAQSHRMRVIAANIANANTTQDANGEVYRRREVVFQEELGSRIGPRRHNQEDLRGVRVKNTIEDPSSLQRAYRPGHPEADDEGFVTLPNINPMEEMVDMMVATRSYEANVAAMKTARSIMLKALEIGK